MNWSLMPEYIAIIILMTLAFFSFEQKNKPPQRTKLFRACLIFSIGTILLNIATVFAIVYPHHISLFWNMLINSAYFFFAMFTASLITCYMIYILFEHQGNKRHLSFYILSIAITCAIMLIFVLINAFTGLLFSFDENFVYVRGPLNRIGYYLLAFNVFLFMFSCILERKHLPHGMRRLLWIAPPVVILLTMLQFLYPDILLNGSMMALILTIAYLNFQSNRLNQDSLTGLNNRSACLQEMNLQLHQHRPTHFMLISLNHFDQINRHFDHHFGDELLYSIGNYLYHALPNYQVYRFGNVAFMLLGPGATPESSETALRKIAVRMGEPWIFDTVSCNLSFVIADLLYDHQNWNETQIVEYLEYAVTHHDETEKNEHLVRFREDIVDRLNRQKKHLQLLQSAIVNKSFQVHYQPIYDCRTQEFNCMEALVRLHDGNNKLISPDEFIPLAEKHGMIDAISRIVFENICHYLQSHPQSPIKTVSINISARQFFNQNFLSYLKDCAAEYRVPPERILIEITERVVTENLADVEKIMLQLQQSGFQFSLDDFGVGYSNFSSVLQLPFSIVKIDQSLISNIHVDEKSRHIIQAIVSLFHQIGIQVVAEGVETKEQAECAKGLGIDRIQGYYYSKPLSAEQLNHFIEST